MRFYLYVLTLFAAACTRGPEPLGPAPRPEPAPAVEATDEPPSGDLPPGHPPIGAATAPPLPEGTPETLPPGHPPIEGNSEMGEVASVVAAANPVLAGIGWTMPIPFEYRQPTSSMRAAEYFVSGAAGEAVLTVFHFPGMGGSVTSNLDRWAAQLTGGPAPRTRTQQVGGLAVHTIDARGSFGGGMGTPASAGEQRLLGAVVEGPQGLVFFKFMGPTATVEIAEGPFSSFVASLRRAD